MDAPLACAAVLLGSVAVAQDAQDAQAAAPPPTPTITYALDVSSRVTFGADLDSAAGDVGIWRYGARLGARRPIGRRGLLQANVATEQSHYDFDQVGTLVAGTTDPVDSVYRVGVGAQYGHQFNQRWGMGVGATVNAAAEYGADFGDALSYGGAVTARYNISETLTLSAGFGFQTELEGDGIVIPVVLADWRINDKWRLQTDTGGIAGSQYKLVLTYRHDQHWSFRLDGGWEFREYRLADDNPLPGGVLQDQRYPISLGATWSPTPKIHVTGSVGTSIYQEFETFNSAGNKVATDESKPSPFLQVSVRFVF